MVNKNGGCSFGKVSRNMIENVSNDFKEFRTEIRGEFTTLKETNTQLYNHLSSRLPTWAVLIMTFGASLLTGIIVWGLSR